MNIVAFLSVGNLCNVRYIKLLLCENRILSLMLHHFAKVCANGATLGRVVKKYMLNKEEKFDMKIFFSFRNGTRCVESKIVALGG